MARSGLTRTGILLIVIAAAVSLAVLLAVLLSKKSDSTQENAIATGSKFQFDNLFSGHYYATRYYVTWISDSEYVRKSGNVTVKTDLNTNSTEAVFIPSSITEDRNVSNWWLSPDRDWVLLACNRKKLYRRSFFADYFAYHMATEKTVQVIPPNPEKQIQLAVWGNNGTSLGFVQDNNIYWKSSVENADTHAITDTGEENKLFNGVSDWVYEEDVTMSNRAMWFSPNGRFLCFAQSNDSHVTWFPYMWYGPSSSAYTNVRQIAYPKPGSPNPVVKMKLVDLTKLPANRSEVAKITDLQPPLELKDQEHYYTNVAWATNDTILVWWLNRIQDTSIVTSCSAVHVSCANNYKQTVRNGWIATQSYLPPNPWISKDGSYYLTLLPFPQDKKGNFIHLAKVTAPIEREGIVSNLTHGVWEVTGILAFDQEREVAYISSAETSPRERHIYSVEVKTGKKSCLTCDLPSTRSGRCKYFTGTFSDQGTWYVLGCLGPGVPRYTLRSTKTNRVIELEDNSAIQEKMDNLLAPKVRNFVIPSGNYELEAQEFLPPDFSKDKKYGVLFDVYGGPATQKVTEIFQLGWIAYLVSNFDLIVVRVDARGSNCRGERFRHAVYKMLGENEAEDVINAGRFMQRKRYVDETKLAIWGWSYGGYLTTYVLSTGSGVFKCGIAVAPVIDWRFYDTAYTERYMALPRTNPEGYANTSLLSRASKFSDVDYLIIHGSGDDNVHYQHTAQMARALTEAEVSFRIQYYTDKAHGLRGKHTRRHLFRLLTKFLTESLGLA